MPSKYKVEQPHRNVLIVRFDVTTGWEQWFMLSADRHHDNKLTDWNLEKKHLKKAEERDAIIMEFGDFFCAMQGKYDKRSDLTQVRPEHQKNKNYLDALIDEAAEFYKPWAGRFLMISKGNHESSVEDRHGTNLCSNLIYRMNANGGNCFYGFYAGWVRFLFTINKTGRTSKNLYYHHGAGGGGPVTRGLIQTNRQSVYLPDADLVVNGHTHDSWIVPIARSRLSDKGVPYQDICYHVRTPGYKRDYNDGAEGFHVERWAPPKPVGCVWMRMYYESKNIKIDFTADVE